MLQNAHKSFKQQLTRHLNKLNYDQRKRKNAYKNFDQNVKNIHQYIVDKVINEPLNFKASMKRGLTMFWLSGGSLCENNKDLGIELLRTTTLDQTALNLLDNPRLVSVHHDEYQVSKHIWDSLLTFHESFVEKRGLEWGIKDQPGYHSFKQTLYHHYNTIRAGDVSALYSNLSCE
eukprot:372843_1